MRNLITVYLHQSYIVSERFEQLNWFSDCCLLRHGYGLFLVAFSIAPFGFPAGAPHRFRIRSARRAIQTLSQAGATRFDELKSSPDVFRGPPRAIGSTRARDWSCFSQAIICRGSYHFAHFAANPLIDSHLVWRTFNARVALSRNILTRLLEPFESTAHGGIVDTQIRGDFV